MTEKTNKHYQNITVTDLEDAQVKIEGELTPEKLQQARTQSLEKLRETTEVDGFRKGNAPDDAIVNQYGEMRILQDAAEIALSEEYGTILQDYNIQAIGQPHVSITKLAPDEPLGFEITTARMPEVTLPDYKKVAKETLEKEENQPADVEASEKEVDDTILQVRRNIAQQRQQESGIETPNQDDALPELTDEFVQSLGEFSNVDDFKQKLQENIKEQKRQQEQEKRRLAVMEALIEASEVTLPDVVVNGELDKMVAQLKEDVTKAGMNFEDYLKQVGKTEEELRGEWRPQAIKKAKSQLILNKIAVEEQMTPDQDQVNQHLERIMSQYQNANRDQAKVFVETQLLNENVLQMLENTAPAEKSEKKSGGLPKEKSTSTKSSSKSKKKDTDKKEK